MSKRVDILMITYNAASYVETSLPRLLESCDDDARVWLWHNGIDEETLDVVHRFIDDPRVEKFHHSIENQRLRAPTNWLWSNSDAEYLSKVDDDCLVPPNWLDQLRHAHEHNPEFGVVGASRLLPQDCDPELINAKIEHFAGEVSLFRNHWVQGSSYLLKRKWVDGMGVLADGQTWTEWCVQAALAGAINGFLWPILFEDHMDDPRSEHTLINNDADLMRRLPLSARNAGVSTIDGWERRLQLSARTLQEATLDLGHYTGLRRKFGNLRWKLRQRRSS